MKRRPNQLLILIACVLLIPVIPFLIFGAWLEPSVEHLFSEGRFDVARPIAFASVIGVLAVDILLPIPSSAVCTFAGKELGAVSGTVACWIGLNLSAAIGYWIGFKYGRNVAKRYSDAETLEALDRFDGKSSVVCIVVCRSLPIIAEASVLLMGIKRLPGKSFWPAVILSNLGVAAALCWLGDFSAKTQWFPAALASSVAIPLLFTLFWKARS